MRQVQLFVFVNQLENKLDHVIKELSVGQKQLICLARALIQKCPILLVDEATANVDSGTDKLIQRTIRREFKSQTIITIAHKIETIIDCDRVIVMKKGSIIEDGRPSALLEKQTSEFYQLARESGKLNTLMKMKTF